MYDVHELWSTFPQFLFLQRKYSEDMQRIYRNLTGANLVSLSLENQLQKLEAAVAEPVQWEELEELAHVSPSSLFQSDFVGLVELRTVLEDLVCLFAILFVHSCMYIYIVVT